jgi:hypothetical protein
MPEPDTPTPTSTDAELGALYKDYNPQGAMGGLFAPAYIHGLNASENAVAAWNATNRPVTFANIEQTRMPNPVQPGPVPMSAGNGVYGGPIPLRQAYGDPKGIIDPEALRVLSQGGKYDFNARRDAIAQQLAANTAATAPPPAAAAAAPDSSKFPELEGYTLQPTYGVEGKTLVQPWDPNRPPAPTGWRYVKNVGQDYNNVGA